MINFLTIISFLLLTNGISSIISKPIKTIETEYGVMYDCVDFYEQPAFQHPLLKNHNFHPQMRPSSRPKRIIRSNFEKDYYNASYIYQFKEGGCPTNTVPIRRISEEDLHRANSLSRSLSSQLQPGTHHAIVQTKSNPGTVIYNGVGGSLSVWNPSTEADQYSSAQFSIQNGLDSIQVGWIVNPSLYKENWPYFFIHTNTAGGVNCFDTHCPGFVIVRSDYTPGSRIPKITQKGGQTYVSLTFLIYKDEANGNWWLELKNSKGENIEIGFWPNKIFSDLAKYGDYLMCGGETYSPVEKKNVGPEMGSGSHLGKGDMKYDAICSNFVAVDETHTIVDADNTEEFCDSDKYAVKDVGHEFKGLGHTLYFGGTGQ